MDDMFVKRVINCVIWHRRVTHGGARCSLLLFWSFYFGKYVDGRCRWQWRKLELAFVWRRRKRRLLGAAGKKKKVENFHLTHFDLLRNLSVMFYGHWRHFHRRGQLGSVKCPFLIDFAFITELFLLKLWNLIQIKRAALSDIFRWIFQKMIFVGFNFEINENMEF